ncbi:MAG: autotransporter domain-containing protein [Gallionellaceae bacterium]|nr:autotransporter domain-containing protein [Gallionellaceae bacterium]
MAVSGHAPVILAAAHEINTVLQDTGTVSLTMTDTLSVTASGSLINTTGATPVYVDNPATGVVITNSGTIRSDGSASAIFIDSGATGTVIVNNTGASIAALGNDFSAIYFAGDLDGSLTNSGTIESTGSASAIGVYVNGDLTGGLANLAGGQITATAANNISSAYAYGIYAGDLTNSSIANIGTIDAQATGVSWASAYGIYVGDLTSASITNSGTITARAEATSGSAYGIYAGGTLDATSSIVNSGTIRAYAPMASQAWSIYASAGTGTVTNSGNLVGSLDLGGTVSLINNGAITIPAGGYGYIGGDYTQDTNGRLSLGATSAAAHAVFTVGGTADFIAGNRLAVVVDPAHTLVNGSVLAGAIDASAGALLAPDGFVVSDNSLALSFTAADTGGDMVDITASSTGLTTVLGALNTVGGDSANGLGSLFDTLLPQAGLGTLDSDMENLLFAVGSQNTAGGVASAVQQFVPLMSGGVPAAILNDLHTTQRIIQERQNASRGLSSGSYFANKKNGWFRPFGNWTSQDANLGAMGYKARSHGFALGAERDTPALPRLGMAFAYSSNNMESKGGSQSARINTYQFTSYGSTALAVYSNIDYQADASIHKTDGTRNISLLGLTAKSAYDSWSAHLGAGYSKTYSMGNKTTFTTSCRADYTYIDSQGYTERGAGGLNLRMDSDSVDELIFSVDGKYATPISNRTTFAANIGFGYDALAERNGITAAFSSLPGATFTTYGVGEQPWSVRGGLGMVMNQRQGRQVTARYDVEGRNNFINQSASIKLRWLL